MSEIIVILPNGTESIIHTNRVLPLTVMQLLVGGMIEFVNVLYKDKPTTMVVNEEGLILQLEFNQKATDIYWAASRKKGETMNLDNATPITGVALVHHGMITDQDSEHSMKVTYKEIELEPRVQAINTYKFICHEIHDGLGQMHMSKELFNTTMEQIGAAHRISDSVRYTYFTQLFFEAYIDKISHEVDPDSIGRE